MVSAPGSLDMNATTSPSGAGTTRSSPTSPGPSGRRRWIALMVPGDVPCAESLVVGQRVERAPVRAKATSSHRLAESRSAAPSRPDHLPHRHRPLVPSPAERADRRGEGQGDGLADRVGQAPLDREGGGVDQVDLRRHPRRASVRADRQGFGDARCRGAGRAPPPRAQRRCGEPVTTSWTATVGTTAAGVECRPGVPSGLSAMSVISQRRAMAVGGVPRRRRARRCRCLGSPRPR